MNKKIKVIDLFNMISNGEEIPEEIKFKNYQYTFDNERNGYYRSVVGSNWIGLTTDFSIIEILNQRVEIIEEQTEIDIQEIEEFKNTINVYDVTLECYHDIEKAVSTDELAIKVNQLIRAVKQLDKKIKEK